MCDPFYISFTSEESKGTYPDNSPTHFKLKLAKPIHLQTGAWKVSLLNFYHPDFLPSQTEMFICMTGVQYSIVGENKLLPMLQCYPVSDQASHPSPLMEHTVVQDYFDCIEIYIKADKKTLETFSNGKANCTLRFAPKRSYGYP